MLSTNYEVKPVPVTVAPNLIVKLLKAPTFFRGYVQGYRQPTALITLCVSPFDSTPLTTIQTAFNCYFNYSLDLSLKLNSAEYMAHAFGWGLCLLQEKAGFPIFDSPKVQRSAIKDNEFQLIIPIMEEHFIPYLVDILLKLVNQSLFLVPHLPDKTLSAEIDGLINTLKPYAPKGSNSLRFLKSAHFADIPWVFIEQNIFQFGYGKKSVWLDSTFTDKTSVLSAGLAKNKLSTAMLLRKAGLPVPEQYFVRTEAEALSAAKKIGSCVVVKPLTEDCGNGVFARLKSQQAVKNAYQIARRYSEQVLVEKQVMGKDYRLQVLHGELIWAVERIPARVEGDGIQPIKALIEALTKQPTIEVTELLAEQGYDLESIPKSGEFVTVNSIANISSGGTPVAVNDKVHPDNKRLAETAANLLRLDIAGIDLIMPDIERSYLEVGGAIIEVNAQPQLGSITAPHIYKEILLKLLPEQGRIPIIGVLGESISSSFIEGLQQVLQNQYQTIGLAQSQSACINGKTAALTESLFSAGRALLLNKTVDALIYQANILDEISVHGLPFDALDYLFIGDEFVLDTVTPECIYWIETLMKACRGLVITSKKVALSLTEMALAKDSVSFNQVPAQDQLLVALGVYHHRLDTMLTPSIAFE